ncbi:hypothetical protein D3C71_720820 [compost metagenome]
MSVIRDTAVQIKELKKEKESVVRPQRSIPLCIPDMGLELLRMAVVVVTIKMPVVEVVPMSVVECIMEKE